MPINIHSNKVELIKTDGGEVTKLLNGDLSFLKEVYVTSIDHNSVRAWKQHLKMTLRISVLFGSVKFIFFEELKSIKENIKSESMILDSEDPKILEVPPGIWFGFKGLGKGKNLIINLADHIHSEDEVIRVLPNIFEEQLKILLE